MPAPQIPIIDIAALRDRSGTADIAAKIGAACRGVGFFYIADHGIADTLLAQVRAAAEAFFDRPDAEKRAVSIENSRHNRGYVPFESEKLDPTRKGDLKEGFNVGRELAADDPDFLAGKAFCGPNQWPADPSGKFKPAMLAYFDAMLALCQDLHRAFAHDLGMPEGFFEKLIDKPLATLRLLHYPPHPGAFVPDQYGAAPHTDYGNVTVLWQDAVGGLEVQTRDGAWIDARPIPGTFVCNIGDCLMRWSNDTYVSTPHRVVNRSGRQRWSIPFFLDPNGDAPVKCLPSCTGPGRPVLYPPTNGADYLRERLDATYAFRQK
jgi:isopenicillin N synthase-like dioxygenase